MARLDAVEERRKVNDKSVDAELPKQVYTSNHWSCDSFQLCLPLSAKLLKLATFGTSVTCARC